MVRHQGSFPKKIKKGIQEIIDAMKAKFIEFNPDYQNIFIGPNFPQEDEVGQFILLCEVVQETFIAVDVLDTSVPSFRKEHKEVKCGDMMGIIN